MVRSTRDIVEDYLRRLAGGENLCVQDLFAKHVDCTVPVAETGPWHASRSLAAEFLRTRLPGMTLGPSRADVDQILVDGPNAVVLGRFTHPVEPAGRSLTTPMAIHFTVRDGLIQAVHLYEDTSSLVARISGKRLLPTGAGTADTRLDRVPLLPETGPSLIHTRRPARQPARALG